METTITPRIVELASILSKCVTEVQAALVEKGHPSPSFEENAPIAVPPNLADLQDKILDASAELHDLFLEPINLIHKNGAVSTLGRIRFNHYFLSNDVPDSVTDSGL